MFKSINKFLCERINFKGSESMLRKLR